jgi:hypothetical protein
VAGDLLHGGGGHQLRAPLPTALGPGPSGPGGHGARLLLVGPVRRHVRRGVAAARSGPRGRGSPAQGRIPGRLAHDRDRLRHRRLRVLAHSGHGGPAAADDPGRDGGIHHRRPQGTARAARGEATPSPACCIRAWSSA